MRKTAESYFRGVDKYNCAQAILKTFQGAFNVAEETILEHQNFGGGRAIDNTCGALYAAQTLESNPIRRSIITEAFIKQAGSPKCNEIRASKTLSCKECVGVTAEILAKLQCNNNELHHATFSNIISQVIY